MFFYVSPFKHIQIKPHNLKSVLNHPKYYKHKNQLFLMHRYIDLIMREIIQTLLYIYAIIRIQIKINVIMFTKSKCLTDTLHKQ